MKHTLALIFTFLSVGTFAQVQTENVDLKGEDHVPLHNCKIFAEKRDRKTCDKLTDDRAFRFSEKGYAVNCHQEFRNKNLERCLSFAKVLANNPDVIDCEPLYPGSLEDLQCATTRKGYEMGLFGDVLNAEASTGTVNSCNEDYYDRSLRAGRRERERLKDRGRTRSILGGILAIGGIIASGSNDGTVRALGTTAAIGGTVLATMGLVDLSKANFILPHAVPGCAQSYVTEIRRVYVDRQECHTTRYTEYGFRSSRSYYHVQCRTTRYVTFEEFSPWASGEVVTTYYAY